MAKIYSTPRRNSVISVDSISGISYQNGQQWFGFTDEDGANFMMSSDVVAHLLSVAMTETKITNLEELLKKLCSCGG